MAPKRKAESAASDSKAKSAKPAAKKAASGSTIVKIEACKS